MENRRFLTCLADDYARLRAVAAKDLDAGVPTCPGWTVADLVEHVAVVYLHKVESMRRQKTPDPWPPDHGGEPPLDLLDRGYSELAGEFATRPADLMAATWYPPDQTVGFWIRRMAQETVVHRIDAELAIGEPVEPVPDDLAVDGIDEVLVVFLAFAVSGWPEEFAADLGDADGRSVRVAAGGSAWSVTMAPGRVTVDRGDGGIPGATVSGSPEAVLRWLWSRGDTGVSIDGDDSLVQRLRRLLVIATQ